MSAGCQCPAKGKPYPPCCSTVVIVYYLQCSKVAEAIDVCVQLNEVIVNIGYYEPILGPPLYTIYVPMYVIRPVIIDCNEEYYVECSI